MNNYFKESVLWTLIVLPYVYLAVIWSELPDQVPTHFDIEGNANGWSSKAFLVFLISALGIGIYFLMLVIPLIDPKKKVQQMGNKYYTLRFVLTFFFSLLTIHLLYIAEVGIFRKLELLFALIGMLFAILGNYFQTIRPNYFIGIRTPWTLENEQVWKETHRLGGRLWLLGGILITILAFAIHNNHIFAIIFNVILFIMVIVPVVFSYAKFKKEKDTIRNK